VVDDDCSAAIPQHTVYCGLDSRGLGAIYETARWVCADGRCNLAGCGIYGSIPSFVITPVFGCPTFVLPSFDKSCEVTSDCAIAVHRVTCYVSYSFGIRASDVELFNQLEMNQQFGCSGALGGSPQRFDYAEDKRNALPSSGGLPTQHVVVECSGGMCRTHVEDLPD
jgi:hypothetical protein